MKVDTQPRTATSFYEVGHFINGRTVDGGSGRWGDLAQPATGQRQGRVAFAASDEVDAAVAAAKEAYPQWSETPVTKRAAFLFRYRDLLARNRDELATLLVKEHGKVWEDACGELVRGLEVVEFACGIPQLLKGEFNEQVGPGIDSWSMRQPLGVTVSITPFNFPAMVPLWTAPIAIACGNTFILKPSERDPSCGLRLAELATDAGLPDGVFNVVNGDKEAVNRFLEHPDVEAVSFVGSTPIAAHVYNTASAHNKRVKALGGAKNHAVVMPDADLEQAADALVGAGYGSAGERCMAISVVVAVGEIGDELVERIGRKARDLKIGNGIEPGHDMGPLITREHLERVRSYVERGVEEGASLVVDGRDFDPGSDLRGGFFLGACLFDNVTPRMSIYQDEIFGPVLSVVRVDTFDQAVELVNNHQYANGTAIFTRDGDTARAFARKIEVGMVGLNVPIPVPLAFHSFGGWKRSLFGSHHMYGPEGVRFFTRLKTVTARWPTSVRKGVNPHFPTMG